MKIYQKQFTFLNPFPSKHSPYKKKKREKFTYPRIVMIMIQLFVPLSENHKLNIIWYQYVFLKKSALNNSRFSKKILKKPPTQKTHQKSTTTKQPITLNTHHWKILNWDLLYCLSVIKRTKLSKKVFNTCVYQIVNSCLIAKLYPTPTAVTQN